MVHSYPANSSGIIDSIHSGRLDSCHLSQNSSFTSARYQMHKCLSFISYSSLNWRVTTNNIAAENPSFFDSLWRRDNVGICHIIKSINNGCLQNEDQKTQKRRHILKSIFQIFVYYSLTDRHRTTWRLVFKDIEPIMAIISKPGFISAYFDSFSNALFPVT